MVAMILTLGLAIMLGSFLKLTIGAYKFSDRSFFSNSCLNLAEAGLEESLYALNNADWTGWTSSGPHMNRTITNVPLGQGATGAIKIRVYNYATSLTPKIVSEGCASLGSGPQVIKQIEIKATTKSFWANGLVTRDTITFSGGSAYVDSYDSADPTHSTGGLYDFSKRKDNGSVGSVLVTTDAVSLGNAEIWGYAATGGAAPTVGPGGKIRGADTPIGVDVDPNRIRTDFSASFNSVTAPSTFDQVFMNISGSTVLGTAGSATVIKASSLRNDPADTTQIVGDVTLVVSGNVTTKGAFEIAADSSLTLYLDGNMDVRGPGVLNLSGQPKNMIIYGTKSTHQHIWLNGNGAVHAAIYAPNAEFWMKGGGSTGMFTGSVVAKNAGFEGNIEVHYDEDLANLATSGVYTAGEWRELHGQGQWVSL